MRASCFPAAPRRRRGWTVIARASAVPPRGMMPTCNARRERSKRSSPVSVGTRGRRCPQRPPARCGHPPTSLAMSSTSSLARSRRSGFHVRRQHAARGVERPRSDRFPRGAPPPSGSPTGSGKREHQQGEPDHAQPPCAACGGVDSTSGASLGTSASSAKAAKRPRGAGSTRCRAPPVPATAARSQRRAGVRKQHHGNTLSQVSARTASPSRKRNAGNASQGYSSW